MNEKSASSFCFYLRKLAQCITVYLHMHLVDAVLSFMDIDWKAFNKHMSSGLNASEMINVAPWIISTRQRELFDSVK